MVVLRRKHYIKGFSIFYSYIILHYQIFVRLSEEGVASNTIIRNAKLTRNDAKGHSNKDIDPSRTHLNFYFKKNELAYIREFDRMKKEYNL